MSLVPSSRSKPQLRGMREEEAAGLTTQLFLRVSLLPRASHSFPVRPSPSSRIFLHVPYIILSSAMLGDKLERKRLDRSGGNV